MSRLGRCLSVRDFEREARRIMPRCVEGYVCGGTEDGASLDESVRALRSFQQISLVLVVALVGSSSDKVRLLVVTKDVWSLRAQFDIPTLKVRYTRVFGWYIEVGRSQVRRVPEGWRRKQTVATGERYTLPELEELADKIEHSEERHRARERELLGALMDQVKACGARLATLAGRLAAWDCAAALADGALSAGGALGVGAVLDVLVYVAAYFARLFLMTGHAKGDADANRRFFVEEQLVATPIAVALAVTGALLPLGGASEALRAGLDPSTVLPALPYLVLVGLCSQGTGIFGALVLLDKSENSYSVPVNRASSLLAGVVATLSLWVFGVGRSLDWSEAVGAGLVISAIGVLSIPALMKKKPKPA